MTKLVQNDLTSLTNEQSALAALNSNYASSEVFSDTVLSRDGSTPNEMLADLDMNSKRILNLPGPSSAQEPLRLQDLTSFLGGGLTISPGRELVTSPRTYFVRSDGNDGNNGLINSAGGAFKTVQKAVDTVCGNIDIINTQVTIQLQSGITFTENVVLKNYSSSGLVATQNEVVIRGDPTSLATAANYVINGGSGVAIVSVRNPSPWRLLGLTLRGTDSTHGTCVEADFGSVIYISTNVRFAAAQFHILAVNAAQVEAISSYEIAGNCAVHAIVSGSGSQFIQQASNTVTLTGTPAFSSAFLSVADGASVLLRTITYSGTATGVRWLADYSALIDVVAGNAPTRPADLETAFANCGNVAGGYQNGKPIEGGGTGGITAAAARLNLGLQSQATHGDSNYTILSTDLPLLVTSASLTAARTWTLPLANSVGNAGRFFTISDQGGINGANTLTIQRGGSDTFQGVGVAANAITLNVQFNAITLYTNGVNAWYLISKA